MSHTVRKNCHWELFWFRRIEYKTSHSTFLRSIAILSYLPCYVCVYVCVCVCVCSTYKIIYVLCCHLYRVTDDVGHFYRTLFMRQYEQFQLYGPQSPQKHKSRYLAGFKSRSANKYVLNVLNVRVLDTLRMERPFFTWNIPTRRNAPSITWATFVHCQLWFTSHRWNGSLTASSSNQSTAISGCKYKKEKHASHRWYDNTNC
jgi:hypothetical protein